MRNLKRRPLFVGVVVAGAVWACAPDVDPAAPDTAAVEAPEPSLWVGCPEGAKFTGGGRIDPFGQKVTFGFNVHANDDCEDIKGQLQVVHHPTHTKYHSTSITFFATDDDDRCAEWRGEVRVKHGNGGWHQHDFTAQACDYGEPGSSPGTGPDTFRFRVSGSGSGHGDTGTTPLTGGNIQAH